MAKNVMKLLKPSPHRGRNDFDLSHRHLFTANFGELLPISFIETVPGDFIKISVSDLLRAMPLVTSPFLRAKQHLDVWFVPYHYLWHNFEEFMTSRSQPTSSAYQGSLFCPRVSKRTVSQYISNLPDTITDIVGRPYSAGALKLFDLCGYGRVDSSGTDNDHPFINLWRILAYNKIWYDEYRQQYYDNGSRLINQAVNDFSPACLFNVDDLPCTSESLSRLRSFGEVTVTTRFRSMFQMRYRCWKKDLFTGLLPSTQFGAVSYIPNSTTGYLQSLDVSGTTQNANWTQDGNSYYLAVDGNVPSVKLSNSDGSNPNGFSVLDLRQSEALQIWRENALRAGNRVSDNMRAHYGDDASYNDERCTLIGSIDAPVNIGDIDSTAQTGASSNGYLGDVAGKALSSFGDKTFKFNAKKFGVIVCMFSLLPEAEYDSTGIDRMNQLLDRNDYFVPEFENLGLEAVSSQTFYSTLLNASTVIGYAPRYIGYKTKLDKVFGSMQSNGANHYWASPKYDVTQVLATGQNSLPLSLLYVNPAIYDHNFAVTLANSDQFLCDVYFDVPAVRPLTVMGLPMS